MSPLPAHLQSYTEPILARVCGKTKHHKRTPNKPQLPVLHTFKMKFAIAIDYRSYRLDNKLLEYNETVSSYITEIIKWIKLQMKAQMFNPNNHIFIIGHLVTFYFISHSNRIQKRAAMRILPHFLNEALVNTFNSRICATDRSSQFCRFRAQCWQSVPQTFAKVPIKSELHVEEVCYGLRHCTVCGAIVG